MTRELIEQINKLKKEKHAIILAHCYQNPEIDEAADYVGDSLGLSKLAARTDAEIIIFAGVYFMAETAKILSPDKKVLLPNIKSGCNMADMIDLRLVREFKAKNPNIPLVCYVNSTAEVKAECDVCCTSANAVEVVKSLNAKKVLFAPDCYLGNWVQKNLPETEIISYPGYCPTHLRISPDDIRQAKEKYKDGIVLIHPECRPEVIEMGDFIGSTTQIFNYVKNTNYKTYIICTEKGVADRLERDYPNKQFILANQRIVCHNMKQNSLFDILNALKNEEFEVTVEPEIARRALNSINKMIQIKSSRVLLHG
ncbi:MAG: quinolinate synthase NadA [Candidatus Gastranaerophilales bacterium]|nr:quinolinate synthase NadA [Candidatus Gastranaerophilales bacterium]